MPNRDRAASDVPLLGLVLAAGEGRRLRPLTLERPKPLCPVGGRPLLGWALDRLALVTGDLAVNLCHGRDQIHAYLDRYEAGRVATGEAAGRGSGVVGLPRAPRALHRSVEAPEPLGTAGAIGRLREVIDGRSVLVVNADTWCEAPLGDFVATWDGSAPRVLLAGTDTFGPRVRLVATLLPWHTVRELTAAPTGLYEVCLGPAHAAGRLEAVRTDATFLDCGTPVAYLAANLLGAGPGGSVIDSGARVEGAVHASVVWPDARVAAGEVLRFAIRTTGGQTVLVRPVRA